jgi:hypothetical protein
MKSNVLPVVRPLAPAVFIGIQSGEGIQADVPLFNLTQSVQQFRTGATVSAKTLINLGYALPEMLTEEDRAALDFQREEVRLEQRRQAWKSSRRSFCSFNRGIAS